MNSFTEFPSLSITAFEFAKDGDVEGHAFHGNKWVGGIPGGKTIPIGVFCKGHLALGKSHHEVAKLAQEAYGSKTTKESVAWYHSQMNKEAKAGGVASIKVPKSAAMPKTASAVAPKPQAGGNVPNHQTVLASIKLNGIEVAKAEWPIAMSKMEKDPVHIAQIKAAVKAYSDKAKAEAKAQGKLVHGLPLSKHQEAKDIPNFKGKPLEQMTHSEKVKATKEAKFIIADKTKLHFEQEEAAKFLMMSGFHPAYLQKAFPKIAAGFKDYTKTTVPYKSPYGTTQQKFNTPAGPNMPAGHATAAAYNKDASDPHSTMLSGTLEYHEQSAVTSYTGSTYQAINKEARDHPSGETGGHYSSTIKALDSAIAKSTFNKDSIVYRSIKKATCLKIFGSEIISGTKTVDHGFASSSKSYQFAHDWKSGGSKNGMEGNVIMEIHAPKGSKGLNVEHMSASGVHEHEILLPRHAEYEVISVKIPVTKSDPAIIVVKYASPK